MPVDAIGAGLELATSLVTLFTPAISQEEKESLLDAYKKRITEIQQASDSLAAQPMDRQRQLALGALTGGLLNAAGFTAPGLASIDIAVPLDDYLQLLTVCAVLTLVTEQTAQQVK